MRIIVTGGGTGGHIFPALEIAKVFMANNAEIIFVGNTNSLEESMAKKAGLSFFGITSKKIVGQSFAKKFLAVFALKLAVVKSLWFLLKTRPKAVVGVGGYVSAPMIMASFFLGIKRYICEQNVMPGLANRVLAHIASAVFISFKESHQYFPRKKTFLTGNPVRSDFFFSNKHAHEKDFCILVTGGSLGARFLNRAMPEALKHIKLSCPDLSITHQTGKQEVEHVKNLYQSIDQKAHVTHFIEDMPKAFKSHDLLVSRAGATVCAEIMASGMPSILVPYPHANAHQRYNAEALSNKGAAITLHESDVFAVQLATVIEDFYQKKDKLKAISKKAKALSSQNAAITIVKHIINEIA